MLLFCLWNTGPCAAIRYACECACVYQCMCVYRCMFACVCQCVCVCSLLVAAECSLLVAAALLLAAFCTATHRCVCVCVMWCVCGVSVRVPVRVPLCMMPLFVCPCPSLFARVLLCVHVFCLYALPTRVRRVELIVGSCLCVFLFLLNAALLTRRMLLLRWEKMDR